MKPSGLIWWILFSSIIVSMVIHFVWVKSPWMGIPIGGFALGLTIYDSYCRKFYRKRGFYL